MLTNVTLILINVKKLVTYTCIYIKSIRYCYIIVFYCVIAESAHDRVKYFLEFNDADKARLLMSEWIVK